MTKIRESDASVGTNNTTIRNARSREEIAEEILKAIESDPGKTHCMYESNTSHKQLARYLDWLQRGGLIESKNSDKKGLFLTEKGKTFYDVLRHVNKALCKNTSIEERTGQLSELDLKRVGPLGNRAQAIEHKNRSRSEIVYGILSATKNNESPAHIMHSVGISYAICKSRLNMLKKYGFVERGEPLKEDSRGNNLRHGQTYTYHNTEQGERLRVALEYINSILYPAYSVSFVKLQRA